MFSAHTYVFVGFALLGVSSIEACDPDLDPFCKDMQRRYQEPFIDISVDGGWSGWSRWIACTATCNTIKGVKTRTRTCTNPVPRDGGQYCNGSNTKLSTCEKDPSECHSHESHVPSFHLNPDVLPAVASGVAAAGVGVGILAVLGQLTPLLAVFGRSADAPAQPRPEPLLVSRNLAGGNKQ